jgi:hypothetical protein
MVALGCAEPVANPARSMQGDAMLRLVLAGIVAIGLLAGPAVGVVGQEEQADPMAPSFFSGTVSDDWTYVAEGAREPRPDGVVHYDGYVFSFPWDADDPRISGTATQVTNGTDYREGATTLAPAELDGVVRTAGLRIVNDDGSWEGPLSNLQIDDLDFFEVTAGWLTGTGTYEGLSAYVVWDVSNGVFRGHITAEGPPSVPDVPAEQIP